ncbi:MAG: DUF1269 domain-containing protein [Ilumatobacter sp.]|nr:DUF1269 domain-containing protein [Ilumatobacter sp.]
MSNAGWDPPTESPEPSPMTVPIDQIETDQALVGISFHDAFRAQEFLTAMARMASRHELRLRDAVIVTKDDAGEVKVRETMDLQPGRTALSGAMWSGLLGLLIGGPVGWVAGIGVGAGAGVVAAKVVDLGVPDEWVDWFRAAVADGTTTVVVLAEDLDVRALEAELHRFAGAELVHGTLPAATIDQLRAALRDER